MPYGTARQHMGDNLFGISISQSHQWIQQLRWKITVHMGSKALRHPLINPNKPQATVTVRSNIMVKKFNATENLILKRFNY